MDSRKKKLCITAIVASVLGIILCICVLVGKLSGKKADIGDTTVPGVSQEGQSVDFSSVPESTGKNAVPSIIETETTTARPASTLPDGRRLPDFFACAYISGEKEHFYNNDLITNCEVKRLEPGKKLRSDFYDPSAEGIVIGGIPILLDYDHSMNRKNGYTVPDRITVEYSEGQCSSWTNYEKIDFDSGASFAKPFTVYWSPFGEGTVAQTAEITVKYFNESNLLHTQVFELDRAERTTGADGNYVYSYDIKLKK